MEDRISHLPNHVLHEILSLLCEKDATKTGILSKRWNSVWNSFPILVFDEYEFSKNHKKVKADFCDSVDRTMRRRYESSIFTERLDIRIYPAERDCGTKVVKHLDSWIDCAVTLKLNQLILVISNNIQTCSEDGKQYYYVLPQCVWDSKWLRVLKLEGCEFSGGSINTIGIGSSLRKLKLHRVRIDETTFHHVISSCFHLEDLRITQCIGFKVLNVVGLQGIHSVRLHLSGDDQSVSIEAPGLRSLGFRGDSSSLGRIIEACLLKKLKEIHLVETDISEFEKLIPELLWLENLSLDKCKLKQSFTVSSGRLMSFSLIECDDVTRIVLDTCCLNRFRYSGNCRLDITWIEASDEVEINHDLSFRCRDHLYGISLDKIAMYLVNLSHCKVLTLSFNGKSKWIASRGLDYYLSCDIERLRLKIMNRHAQVGRSCLLILEEFLRICRRPSSVLMELGAEESVVMRLDFVYEQEGMEKGRVIDGNCGSCRGSSCWRCCLWELEISQNVHARRDRDARKLVEFFKVNALCLKKISYVESKDDIHSQVFDCCSAPKMQINGPPRHLVLRFA